MDFCLDDTMTPAELVRIRDMLFDMPVDEDNAERFLARELRTELGLMKHEAETLAWELTAQRKR